MKDLYLIKMNCPNGFYKIGISDDVKQRFATLKGSSPYELELIHVFAEKELYEPVVHQQLSEYSVKGEWFNFVGIGQKEIIDKIQNIIDYEEIIAAEKEKPDNEFFEICHYIDQNYQEKKIIEKAAAKFGRTKRTLQRKFQKYLGLTPQDYILRRKISFAENLICIGKSVGDAAAMTGFCNASAFSRKFQKINGYLPKKVKMQHKQERKMVNF